MSAWQLGAGAVNASMGLYYYITHTNWEQRDSLECYPSANEWDYQRRNPRDPWQSGNRWIDLWPRKGLLVQDSIVGYPTIVGNAISNDCEAGRWDQWTLGLAGAIRPNYIRGTLVDVNNAPVGGAIVESFVTATNAPDGQATADAAGNYEVPCYTPTGGHFVVAYAAGSPDKAGVSVNTLTPQT